MATILRQERASVIMHEIRIRDVLKNMKKERFKTL